MREREEVIDYCRGFDGVCRDISSINHGNLQFMRYKVNWKSFIWMYERYGDIWINVRIEDTEWRDFLRQTYKSVIPGYLQNEKYWNTIILDGTVPEEEIKKMIVHSYDLITGKN